MIYDKMKTVLSKCADLFKNKYSRFGYVEMMALAKYPSPIRWMNALHNSYEYAVKRSVLRSYPPCINIATSTTCNLRCGFCYTGQRQEHGRKQLYVSLDLVEKTMREIGKYAILARLYGHGEPLLVKQLPEIVDIVHRRRVYSFISTNMNHFDEDHVRRTLQAGLDHVIVAIDGATPESYVQYREGGDFQKVLANTRRLVELKRELGRKDLLIEWQFVLFKHNQHELEIARDLSRQLACDLFSISTPYVTDPAYLPDDKKYNPGLGYYATVYKCRRPWTNFVLHPDGGIAACMAHSYHRDDDVADYNQLSFREAWQRNPRLVGIRRKLRGLPTDIVEETACDKVCFKVIKEAQEKHLTPSDFE